MDRDAKGRFVKGAKAPKSAFSKGHTPWNKGKSCPQISKAKTGVARPDLIGNQFSKGKNLGHQHGFKKNQIPWNKGKQSGHITHTTENIKKMLKRNPMSSLEKKFEKLCIENNINLKFVGDGEIFINKKIPDFVNEDKKIAVEVFYRKHKEQFRNGLNEWKKQREALFKEAGWRLLFFDETQVTQQNICQIEV